MAKKKKQLSEKQLEQLLETRIRVQHTMKIGQTFRNFLPVVDDALFKIPALKPVADSEQLKNVMVGSFFEMALEVLSGTKIKAENISFSSEEEAPIPPTPQTPGNPPAKI
jgi:hypothetical protein